MAVFPKLLSNLWGRLANKKRCPVCKRWNPRQEAWEIVDYYRGLATGTLAMKQAFLCRGCGHRWGERSTVYRDTEEGGPSV